MRRLLLLCLLLLTAAAPAPPGRPLWWKISDGRSTLWIMGVPGQLPHSVKWDDSALRKRVAQADRLYYPPIAGLIKPLRPTTQIFIPSQSFDPVGPKSGAPYPGASAAIQPAPDAVETPPDLRARFLKDAAKFNFLAPSAMDHVPTSEMAGWLDARNWPDDKLTNDPAWELYTLTHSILGSKKPIAQFQIAFPISFTPTEAVQDACLAQVLDETESGHMPAARMAAAQAWARGDLDNALKRASSLPLCLRGQLASTDMQAGFERVAVSYVSALDEAFDKGGVSVTVTPFDPLLADDGILDHYRRLGYEITVSDGME